MSRMLLVLPLLFLAGCASRPSGAVTATPAPLTAEEKAAWAKYRRNQPKDRYAVLLRSTEGEWYIKNVYGGGDLMNTFYGAFETQEGAAKTARGRAEAAEWSAVVVVDLDAGESPAAVRWFTDNGKGVKESPTAPTPEIATSLNVYILQAQKKCGSLTP